MSRFLVSSLLVTLILIPSGCLEKSEHPLGGEYDGSDEDSTEILDLFLQIEIENNTSWEVMFPIPMFNNSTNIPSTILELIENNSRFELEEYESNYYMKTSGIGNDTILILDNSSYGERLAPEITFTASNLIIESDDDLKLFLGIRYLIRTCPDTTRISFIPSSVVTADLSILDGWSHNDSFSNSRLIHQYGNGINSLNVISSIDNSCYKIP